MTEPVRRRWLTWSRYSRTWESVCTLHGLTATLCERTLLPALRFVCIGTTADVLAVRIVTGQSLADGHKQSDALAVAWRADRITITSTAPGELKITLMRGDVLAEPVALPMPTPATPAEPLFVVVIDEIAALTAYVTDRKVRSEVEQLLGLLLSQGRAVGISVVVAVQDPAKETSQCGSCSDLSRVAGCVRGGT